MIKSIADLIAGLPKRPVKLPDEYYDERAAGARDLAFTVSRITQLDVIQAILDSLDRNIQAGGSFASWKRAIADDQIPIDLPEHRKELIFRNHAQTAFSAGKCKNFATNQSSRPFLMYSAVGDNRTRPTHARLDGVIRPVGDDWWHRNMPPNGHNCRCSVIALTERQAKKQGGVTENPPEGADFGWGHSPCHSPAGGSEGALERKEEGYNPKLRGYASKLLSALTAIKAFFN